jgi:hypothetical protein
MQAPAANIIPSGRTRLFAITELLPINEFFPIVTCPLTTA